MALPSVTKLTPTQEQVNTLSGITIGAQTPSQKSAALTADPRFSNTTKPNISTSSASSTPTTPAPAPKPAPVVTTAPAKKQIDTMKSTLSTVDQNKADMAAKQAQADAMDAAAKPTDRFLTGSGKVNPNYVDPSKATATPQTAEDKILSQPQPGNQVAYNTYTGESKELPQGVLPVGYSTSNPLQRTDVASSVSDEYGTTIKKFSDGTYGRFDINNNYTQGTQQMFDSAQRVNDANTKLDNLNKGIYTTEQQTQIDNIKTLYTGLITKQTTANDNATGGQTVAQNLYGMGNTISGQGEITKVINDGIQKITTLQAQRDNAIATMKQAFQSDDIKLLESAYTQYNTSQKDIQTAINKTQTYLQTQADKVTLRDESNAISMGNKFPDTSEPILISDSPADVQKKLLTSVRWQADQANKVGVIDPEVLSGMLDLYKKGTMPNFGFGASAKPLREAFYKALGGNPNAIDESTKNKALLKGAEKALATQSNQLAGTETSLKTLGKTLDLAKTYSDKVDRTGSPFFAKYALFLSGKVQGDADTAAFQALMKTAATEYGKIMTGAASSISGATVKSTEDAESMINAEMSKGQVDEVMSIMRKDANFRLESQKDTISDMANDIKDLGSGTDNKGNPVTTTSPTGGKTFKSSTGKSYTLPVKH